MTYNENSNKCQKSTPGKDKKVKASICPQNCLSCSSAFDCSQCASGYQYVSSTNKCEASLTGINPAWLALPTIIGGAAVIVAIIMIVRYRNLQREVKDDKKEDDAIKSSNEMLEPDIASSKERESEGPNRSE
jgi:hypothetical protein